ncbi:MAG: Rne/Rng family ribonuclease [Nitrospirae bacterium]|nr:Rne/Rng family ribonuclease [Nitrospirota bacterium]
MSTEIIINASREESRVALLENKAVTELYLDRKKERSIVGNIYKGKVAKVLPGMQAAFVDVGLERSAFLYVSDVAANMEEYARLMEEETGEDRIEFEKPSKGKKTHPPKSIEELLQEGQEILVQVTKEPMGTKGARLTSYVSLPGRHLVFMPGVDHVGISRRIQDDQERARLKEVIRSAKKPGNGYIVRTASEGVDREAIVSDTEFLELLWQNIQRKMDRSPAPALLYSELDLIFRTVRDLFTLKVDRLIIDNAQEYERIREFVKLYLPALLSRLELYEKDEPIFEEFGIEGEITRALGKKIWLKSGGYIIIDHTEALTVIDVNTGRYVGKRDQEETITQTNLEAVKEVAYQLRLRNIGGIIIIDFIDMEKQKNRERVFHAFQEAMADDRARPNILRISELGLVEMSRKRTRENLLRTLMAPCDYCDGRGYTESATTVCYQIFREIRKVGRSAKDKKLLVTVNPAVAGMLMDEERQGVEDLEKVLEKRIVVKADAETHIEDYTVTPLAH